MTRRRDDACERSTDPSEVREGVGVLSRALRALRLFGLRFKARSWHAPSDVLAKLRDSGRDARASVEIKFTATTTVLARCVAMSPPLDGQAMLHPTLTG